MDTKLKEFIQKNNFVKNYHTLEYPNFKKMTQEKIGYIKVNLDFPGSTFIQECLDLFELRKPFTYSKHQELDTVEGWNGVILADNGKSRATPMSNAPKLTKWFKEHPCFDFSDHMNTRIHIHYLEPNCYIPLHQDYETDTLKGLNFAVTQPKDCKFYVDEYGVIPFEQPGDVFLCQIGKQHCVYNNSDEIRIHVLPKGPYLKTDKIINYINP